MNSEFFEGSVVLSVSHVVTGHFDGTFATGVPKWFWIWHWLKTSQNQ